MGQASAEVLADWVHRYAVEAGRDDNLDAFVAHVDGAILREIPELRGDPVLVADLHASTRAQFQVFLSLLERERQELLLPPQAVDLALSIARRQLELAVLLKVYRIAAGAVWDFFTQVAASVPDDGPDRSDVLIYLWGHGGTWINEAIEQLIGVFYAEREATMHGTLARRTEAVHALLRGERIAVDEASRLLDHPLRARQTAMVVWSGAQTSGQASADAPADAPADALVGLNQLAAAIASSVGASVLTLPAGRGEVWSWLSTPRDLDPDEVMSAACSSKAAPGARVALGTCGVGIDGFLTSHREAVEAQRFAVAVPDSGRCLHYRDVELTCLVAGNEDGVRALIARELRGLADPEPALDRIRETVATYLELGGSVEQTAARLFVHKNTIRYRLAQAEELVGHPLAERRTEIALALRCLPRYP